MSPLFVCLANRCISVNLVHVSLFLVCKKYLSQCPEGTDLLWEVESIGGPYQRTNIARKIQTLDLSGETEHKLDFTLGQCWIKGTDLREPSNVLTLSTYSNVPSFPPQMYLSVFHSLKNHM